MPTRVLIVEDNPVARSFLMRVVSESFSDDIEFAQASDLITARAALGLDGAGSSALAGEPFRLVLCDLEVEDSSGLELLAQLSQYPATKIATTLHSDDEHLFPALQCGADGYLLKEDRFEVLVEELQKIVRGQPPVSPAIARRLLAFFRTPSPGMPNDGSALSPREHEVLTAMSKGFTLKEVARSLSIQWFAVNDHIRSVYRKLAEASALSMAASRSAADSAD
jgi:two-component system, NarL family, nitrate/nitrite response regulator NarL